MGVFDCGFPAWYQWGQRFVIHSCELHVILEESHGVLQDSFKVLSAALLLVKQKL